MRHTNRCIRLACMLWFAVTQTLSQVVISQVYGGGGNAGSVYRNDFIELFNRGEVPVAVQGWSVQYAASAGSSWQATSLSGAIQPHSWYLVQEAGGSGGTQDLPFPDASGSISLSSTGGKVALVDTAASLTGACPQGIHVRDFVGWGAKADCWLGSGAAPATGSATAVARLDSGMVDTRNNAADFVAVKPSPRSSAAIPLAVQLTHFRAVRETDAVRITWSTASEIDNFGFYVQRREGLTGEFVRLEGSFRSGYGTTLVAHAYEFLDRSAILGTACEYRLLQMDLDSTVHYSDPVEVEDLTLGLHGATKDDVVEFAPFHPNPSNPLSTTALSLPRPAYVRVVLYDLLGREITVLVNGDMGAGKHVIGTSMAGLASGAYLCEATVQYADGRGARRMVQKLIVQR